MEKRLECKKPKDEHNWWYVTLMLTAILFYTVTVGFNVLNTLGNSGSNCFYSKS